MLSQYKYDVSTTRQHADDPAMIKDYHKNDDEATDNRELRTSQILLKSQVLKVMQE